MPARFSLAIRLGLLAATCLGGCVAPNRVRSPLGQAVIPSEYRSADGQFLVRLRGGTPATYQVVRARDGRALGRAQSAIVEGELHTGPPTPDTVNVVFAADDTLICVEEELGGHEGPASRYILFRNNLAAQRNDLGFAVSYLQPEANVWSPQPVHYGEAYEWPQVLGTDQATIRFYYPRSKQLRRVSLDSIHATDRPTTQE